MTPLSAPVLYAISLGDKCQGDESCHWCDGPALRQWKHDDRGPTPFTKERSPSKNPTSIWICRGCWLFRRPRVTVRFLNDSFLDSQPGPGHSWWITTEGAWGILKDDKPILIEKLLNPPNKFVLSIITEPSINNHLQLAVVNDFPEILADTLLSVSINNVVFKYSVYELDDAFKRGVPDGKEAGVRELFNYLGSSVPSVQVREPRSRGEKEERMDPRDMKKLVVVKK